jgi:hypothetical protein
MLPQYYFRVRDGGSLLPDDGASQEFATMEEVREEAVESARQLLSNAVLTGKAGSLDQQIEVMTKLVDYFLLSQSVALSALKPKPNAATSFSIHRVSVH